MAWPPTTHQDVEVEVDIIRTGRWALAPAAGAWFTPTGMRQSGSDVAPAAGVLGAQALILGTSTTLTDLWVQVGTAGDIGSRFRLGVYTNRSGDFYPDSLLVDAGTVPADVVGRQGITGLTLALKPGVYWLAGVSQSFVTTAPLYKNSVRGVAYFQLLGNPDSNPGFNFAGSDNGFDREGWSMTGVTGALPAAFSSIRTRIAGSVMIVGRAA